MKKQVELRGFEPLAPCLPDKCSPTELQPLALPAHSLAGNVRRSSAATDVSPLRLPGEFGLARSLSARRRAYTRAPVSLQGWPTTPVRCLCVFSFAGGAEGIRTPDLVSAIDALSQLSYSPSHEGRVSICEGVELVKVSGLMSRVIDGIRQVRYSNPARNNWLRGERALEGPDAPQTPHAAIG